MESKAFRDGESSYFRFRGAYHNRYCPGTPGHQHFKRGWNAAMKSKPALRKEYEMTRSRRATRRMYEERTSLPFSKTGALAY